MKSKIFLAIFAVVFMLFYTGCDNSTDPEETVGETEVETALKEVDAMVGKMMNSKMTSALLFMPDLPVNIPVSGFMKLGTLQQSNLSLSKTQDSSFFDFLSSLDSLFGVYTYDGVSWTYSSGSQGEIVFVYPYFSLGDSQQHTAEIKIYNFVISNSTISLNIDVNIDGENHFETIINVTGSGFLNPTGAGTLENVFVNGRVTDSDGASILFSITVTSTEVEITVEGSLAKRVTITITGTNILPANLSGDSAETQITEIKIEYEDVAIVINEFEQETGDIGDVLYQGNKVGDFMVKADSTQYIKFNSGNEKNIAELMVNLNTAILLLSAS